MGRAIASAARNATLKEVEKASSGLRVSGSGLRQTSTPVSGPGAQRTGSGRFSHPMIVARKIQVTTRAPRSATPEMMMRVRSSSRCSTSVTRSACPRRRGKRGNRKSLGLAGRDPLALGLRRAVLGRDGGGGLGDLDALGIVVLPRQRVLELADAVTDRAAHLRQALGAED